MNQGFFYERPSPKISCCFSGIKYLLDLKIMLLRTLTTSLVLADMPMIRVREATAVEVARLWCSRDLAPILGNVSHSNM